MPPPTPLEAPHLHYEVICSESFILASQIIVMATNNKTNPWHTSHIMNYFGLGRLNEAESTLNNRIAQL